MGLSGFASDLTSKPLTPKPPQFRVDPDGDLAKIGPKAQELTNQATETAINSAKAMGPAAEKAVREITSFPRFQWYYLNNLCWRAKVNSLYKNILLERSEDAPKVDWWGPFGRSKSELEEKAQSITSVGIYIFAAEQVYRKKLSQAQNLLAQCIQENKAQVAVAQEKLAKPKVDPNRRLVSPFDRRVDRLNLDRQGEVTPKIPYDTRYQDAGTIGYVISKKTLEDSDLEGADKDRIIAANNALIQKMRKDDYYLGVPALTNTYALTKLYGSKGGEYLTDRKGERKWYEIDQTQNSQLGFSSTPTTSSIIFWGNGDPYGRTPYHFTDFVFCKYWNVVETNRLITLRRFPAPILDNMKFPGMDGTTDAGNPAANDKVLETITTVEKNNPDQTELDIGSESEGTEGQGSGAQVTFPPMATALTYFGEETENNLSDILKFTTGLKWGDVEAGIWNEVSPPSTPDADSGPAGLYGGLSKYAKMLNIAQGNFNNDAILNQGALPPDPYVEGPYENRIIGPVNRINSVKKREPGIDYQNNISLNFDYVARPIGGINTKAALLDIMSNFLVIGSATAVFWGGQHRFLGDPQKYPFIGGDKGIQQWYRGDPVGWGETSITRFTDSFADVGDGVISFAKNFFNTILSGGSKDAFGGLKSLFSGNNVGGNALKAIAASKSTGQVPYLSGLKALLIGEPVGEWHLTVGNPLNPIAMIGNLICTGIEVEFGNELGPDDFPLEMRVKVNLEHGMARDRDAIQSIFNRGMGRIYDLPDEFAGSADYETRVDNKTGNRTKTGNQPVYYKVPIADSTTVGGRSSPAAVKENSLKGDISVWNRPRFSAVSPNENLTFTRDAVVNRSVYRSADWVALKSLR